jgi:hypothetical protein
MTEAMTRLLGLSKKPVHASNMKHRAIPCGMFADKPPCGWPTFDSTASRAAKTSIRPPWGRPFLSSVSRRLRSLKTPCAYLHPRRPNDAHEAMRVDFVLYGTVISL